MLVKKYYTIAIVMSIALQLGSCSKSFLEQNPLSVYDENSLLNKKGLDGMLVNAYASLDGINTGNPGRYAGSYNWIWGSILGGEAYKAGVNYNDQVELNAIMQYSTASTAPQLLGKWNAVFDGVGRANQLLKALAKVNDPTVTTAMLLQYESEARFIRAYNFFEGKKVFNNIPYINEEVIDFKIPNTDDGGNYVNIWPQIEDDLLFAYENLSEVKPLKGQVNKWAAGAFLAKAYLYQYKYAEAKVLFEKIITEGKNAQGVKYDLMDNFSENFRLATQNNKESVLEVQNAIGDGSLTNGFVEMILCYPNGIAGGTNSWFFRPSQNLVNAFRTNADGLPLIETYNHLDVTSFEDVADDAPFVPYAGNLDPRLDHTVGRRGIPFLDWGMMSGVAFTAPPGESIANGGPYTGKKHVFSQNEFNGGFVVRTSWYISSALNYQAMRFADVLLMAAECEVEAGSLDKAREYVNRVRQRAANSRVKNLDGTSDAANYVINEYAIPWSNQDTARAIVQFERRLELAMEGHRFFDLVRWGIADQVINEDYLPKESIKRHLILGNAKFIKNKSEYQPIPDYAITQSIVNGIPTLKQNPGY